MSTEAMQCNCGQRVQQRVEGAPRAYVVTFTDPSGQELTACPGCARPLYEALCAGDLKAHASNTQESLCHSQ